MQAEIYMKSGSHYMEVGVERTLSQRGEPSLVAQ